MIRSIQGRLILTLTAAAALLALAAGLILYDSIRRDLVRQFDSALNGEASAVASFVALKPDGSLDFDYNDVALEEFRQSPHAQYFVIRFADGRLFRASNSLRRVRPESFPIVNHPADVKLPTGRTGRAVCVNFVPGVDADDPLPATSTTAAASAPTSAGAMNIIVARDRASLDASLNHFLLRMILGAALLAAATAAAVILIVGRSLRPLRDLAEQVTQIDTARLHLRLPRSPLPAELAPIWSCLTELFERLDAAFTRERRFTADVAHELRTPIAELRSLTEVALRHPEDAPFIHDALRDAHDVSSQMQTLVNTLLDLVRSEKMPAVAFQQVALAPLIAGILREIASAAPDGSSLQVRVPDDAIVMAEPTLLASALRNILANAVEYRAGEAPVTVAAEQRAAGWNLKIENRTDRLAREDMPHLFDPFWRKDAARSSAIHSGLGLSLVSAYCQLMRISVAADLSGNGVFTIELNFAQSAGAGAGAGAASHEPPSNPPSPPRPPSGSPRTTPGPAARPDGTFAAAERWIDW